jgi:hypothetical protein
VPLDALRRRGLVSAVRSCVLPRAAIHTVYPPAATLETRANSMAERYTSSCQADSVARPMSRRTPGESLSRRTPLRGAGAFGVAVRVGLTRGRRDNHATGFMSARLSLRTRLHHCQRQFPSLTTSTRAAGVLAGERNSRARGSTLRRRIVNIPARLARPQHRPVLRPPRTPSGWAEAGAIPRKCGGTPTPRSAHQPHRRVWTVGMATGVSVRALLPSPNAGTTALRFTKSGVIGGAVAT